MIYLGRGVFLLIFILQIEMQSFIDFPMVLKTHHGLQQPVRCAPVYLSVSSLPILHLTFHALTTGPLVHFHDWDIFPSTEDLSFFPSRHQGRLPVNINFLWICTLMTSWVSFWPSSQLQLYMYLYDSSWISVSPLLV